MNRRKFLTPNNSGREEPDQKNFRINEFANKTLPLELERTAAGLEPYAGPWGADQALHLLRRTTFGVKKSEIDLLKSVTVSSAVDQLLTVPLTTPNPPVNNYVSTADGTGVLPGQTWVNAAYDNTYNFQRYLSLKGWWINLMITGQTSILEKMTLFWHNHFSTETVDTGDARYSYKYLALLRQSALGNFKLLTKQITTDPAMLRYLNGYLNSNTAPDENYARELQELFTLGKGPGSQYTENDVKQAARVLTGWRVDGINNTSFFDSARHDTGNKTFSSFYGNTVITGRTGATAGSLELDDLITMIFAQDEVARFIARKLYRFFIYYVIDSSAETNVITPLADIIRKNNYEMKPAVSALLKSAHFYDPINMGCMIKSPVDLVVGLCREFNINAMSTANPPAVLNDGQIYGIWEFLRNQAALMQMNIGDPPNVAGWPAYYQDPQYYELWINADTLPRRNQFSDTMISNNGYSRLSTKLVIDPVAYAEQFLNASDPNTLINQIVEHLYPIQISDTLKSSLKVSSLLSGQISDHYWTDAWELYKSAPSNSNYRSAVSTRLQSLLKSLMSAAEYQLS